MPKPIRALVLTFILIPMARASDCALQETEVLAHLEALAAIETNRSNLERQYPASSLEDFSVQAGEGSLEIVSRGAGVKAAFARRQMLKALAERATALSKLREAFCSNCLSKPTDQQEMVLQCRECPEREGCL